MSDERPIKPSKDKTKFGDVDAESKKSKKKSKKSKDDPELLSTTTSKTKKSKSKDKEKKKSSSSSSSKKAEKVSGEESKEHTGGTSFEIDMSDDTSSKKKKKKKDKDKESSSEKVKKKKKKSKEVDVETTVEESVKRDKTAAAASPAGASGVAAAVENDEETKVKEMKEPENIPSNRQSTPGTPPLHPQHTSATYSSPYSAASPFVSSGVSSSHVYTGVPPHLSASHPGRPTHPDVVSLLRPQREPLTYDTSRSGLHSNELHSRSYGPYHQRSRGVLGQQEVHHGACEGCFTAQPSLYCQDCDRLLCTSCEDRAHQLVADAKHVR